MRYSAFCFLCIALLALTGCYNNTGVQNSYVADNDSCHAKAEGRIGVYFSGDYSYQASDKDKNGPSFQLYCDCMKQQGWAISSCPKSATETATVSPAPVAPVTATATIPSTSATATSTVGPAKTTVTTTPSTTTITTTITSTPVTTTTTTAPTTVTVTSAPNQNPATMNLTAPATNRNSPQVSAPSKEDLGSSSAAPGSSAAIASSPYENK